MDRLVFILYMLSFSKAAHYTPEDDDYQMLVALCYIKLNEYDNAVGILEVLHIILYMVWRIA